MRVLIRKRKSNGCWKEAEQGNPSELLVMKPGMFGIIGSRSGQAHSGKYFIIFSRCLLPTTPQMTASLPPLTRRSRSRPRLLQRPQMPRRGEQSPLGCRPFASRSQSRSRMATADAPIPSEPGKKRRRCQRNKLGR
ncbi:unnamed protein product [Cylicostephanus goldi]|uniref:Uncharacterized protein n=1 Tax=Cylicostephanus goldi TaxID=71465 RepID=A0A3P6RRI8_CYLGO|nr:unnamed protein product [Cylicostephanus goldi]